MLLGRGYIASMTTEVKQVAVMQKSKWEIPGWRIEQRYSPGVLIGNWSEERDKFERGREFGNSTHRHDFSCYAPESYRPDVSTRRRGLLMNDGLGKKQIFTHHGDRYNCNTISLYDQQFNRRHSTGARRWDRHRLAWLPEASDNPLQGASTKFGLKQEVEARSKRLQALHTHGDFETSYAQSFRKPVGVAHIATQGTPRLLSTKLHPHHVNKHLHLRGKPLIVKPEIACTLPADNKLAATV